MNSEIEPSEYPERQASPAAVMAGVELQRWIYGQIAEGLLVDEKTVRERLESDVTLSEQGILDAYKVADDYNEKMRAELYSRGQDDIYEAQIRTHESVTFLVWSAAEARMASDGYFDKTSPGFS